MKRSLGNGGECTTEAAGKEGLEAGTGKGVVRVGGEVGRESDLVKEGGDAEESDVCTAAVDGGSGGGEGSVSISIAAVWDSVDVGGDGKEEEEENGREEGVEETGGRDGDDKEDVEGGGIEVADCVDIEEVAVGRSAVNGSVTLAVSSVVGDVVAEVTETEVSSGEVSIAEAESWTGAVDSEIDAADEVEWAASSVAEAGVGREGDVVDEEEEDAMPRGSPSLLMLVL